jgi:hypothetical protein
VIRLGLALLLGLAAVYAFGAQWGWDALLPALPDPPATERTRSLELGVEADTVAEPVVPPPVEAKPHAPPVREYALAASEWQEGSAAAPVRDDPPEVAAAPIRAPAAAAIAEDAAPADAPTEGPDPLEPVAVPPETVDLDRSAELVRRMLSLHRRAGGRR